MRRLITTFNLYHVHFVRARNCRKPQLAFLFCCAISFSYQPPPLSNISCMLVYSTFTKFLLFFSMRSPHFASHMFTHEQHMFTDGSSRLIGHCVFSVHYGCKWTSILHNCHLLCAHVFFIGQRNTTCRYAGVAW